MRARILIVLLALMISAPACKKKKAGGPAPAPTPEPEARVEVLMIPSKVDAVDFRILFSTGSVDDPEGKEGLTALTAGLMAEGGTASHTYPELLDILYPMAAEVHVQVDRELTVFMARVHRDHLDEFVPLIAEIIVKPRFDEKAFSRLRADALNHIRKELRMASDEQLSIQALDTWIHEDHPYGHVVAGTVKGLESITLADVKAHWAQVFSRDRLVVGLAGAVDETLSGRMRVAFEPLPEKGAPAVEIPDPEPISGIQVRIIEKNTDSTAITMGYPLDVRRDHADYHALWLAQSALGEHRQSSGRLFQTIREERGLNYGDYAYIEPYVNHGRTTKPTLNIARSHHTFSLWIRPVQHKHRLFTVRLMFHTLGTFIEKGLDQDELDRVRGFLAGYTAIFEESLDRRLGYALDDLFYGADEPFLSSSRAAMQGLSLDQVNAAIKKHVRAGDCKVVIVTRDGEALKKELGEGVAAVIEYDTPKPDEVHEADKQVVGFDPGFKADLIEVVPVESLFEE
ncbi:MAG: insulinase family protein [Deltaproteobacteria bacterium]|nr:insulinase family protein [Deltaproteobacteria bacterium]